jgi:hypothetical protein
MSAAVNVRCPNPVCPWVGRSRPVRVDVIGFGVGVFGMLRLVCECRTELEAEVVNLGVTPPAPLAPEDADRRWAERGARP